MYLQCSWGTSVCVCGDVTRLKPGHDLHCSLHCAEEHRAYSSLARGKQCSFKFKAGAKVYRCRHNHFGHDYIALSAEEGSVCCCNDNKSWKPSAAPSCQYHDAGPLDPTYTGGVSSQPQLQHKTSSQSGSAVSKHRCGHVFQPGEDIYHCRDCSSNELTVLCSRCFHSSNCVNHRWRMGEFQGTTKRQRHSKHKGRSGAKTSSSLLLLSSSVSSSASSLSRSGSPCSSTTSSVSSSYSSSSASVVVGENKRQKAVRNGKSKKTKTPQSPRQNNERSQRSDNNTAITTLTDTPNDCHSKTSSQNKGKGRARQMSEEDEQNASDRGGDSPEKAASTSAISDDHTGGAMNTKCSRFRAESDVKSDNDEVADSEEEEEEEEEELEAYSEDDQQEEDTDEVDLDDSDEGVEGDDQEDEHSDEDEEDDEAPISCDCGDPSMFKSAFDCNYHLPDEYRPIQHLKFCNYQFRVQEMMYHCRTCHVPGAWICVRCYDSVQHAGHPIDQERNVKNEGRYCKCGDQMSMLAKLECRDDHNRQNILCTNDIKEGTFYYSCEECFIKAAHEGHKYQRLCAPAGFEATRCACGENSAFRYATHCETHERINGSNIVHRCYYTSKAGEWIATCRDCYPFEETPKEEKCDNQQEHQATTTTKIRYLCMRCRQGSDHIGHRVEWIRIDQDMTHPCACGSELGFEPDPRPLCQYHTTLHKTVPSTTLFLHSHSHRSLNHPDHNEVTGYRYHNSDNDWIVCRPEGVGSGGAGGSNNNNSNHESSTGSPYLQWRDVFWLKHANTGLYLNSMANLKIPQGFQEVTTIAGFHSNNDWIIEETTWLRQQILSDE
ncbi:hypothetical protein BGW42_004413 [Actinomortierella wolfii]|nr:hypothetical protein BGW42_004413 [Actinomortierella wolfii]